MKTLIQIYQGLHARAGALLITGVDGIVKPLADIESQLMDHALNSSNKASAMRKQAWDLEDQADTLEAEAGRAVKIANQIQAVLA